MVRSVLASFSMSVVVSFSCFGAWGGPPEAVKGGRAEFAEQPGVVEFSGRMIARPSQRGVAGAQGRSLIVTNFSVHDYVAPNDEIVFWVPKGQTENLVAGALMGTGLFEYVEPDWICYPVVTPNDTWFSRQWHHVKIESTLAWDWHTGGAHVTIAICDTGIRTTHEDFLLNRKEGYNAEDRKWESQGGAVNDVNGHGSHTSGIAAANGNNGKGVTGVGWNLSHRMMRVTNRGNGAASMSTLTHAALTAASVGDRVVNVSYSGADSSSVRTTATSVKGYGGLLFWAAGNNNVNMSSLNRDNDDVLVIGASTSADGKASFSNYGTYVDFFAPGVDIYSTYHRNNSSYAYASGTSMAAPMAAGLAALVWSTNPSLTPNQVEAVLKNSCDPIGSFTVFGYGRINARRAVDAVR